MPSTSAVAIEDFKANPPAPKAKDLRDGRARGVLVAILVLSTLIDLFFFTGFYSSDDIDYLSLAHHVLQQGQLPDDARLQGAYRIVVLGWNFFVMWLLGPKAQVVAGSYILFHQLLNALTYLLAARVFDRRTALVAAYLTALCPMLISFSTAILPDIPLTCFFVLSLYAFLRAYDPGRDAGVKAPVSPLWMFISGAAVGLAYLSKESGLVLLPFYFFLWLIFSRKRRLPTILALGTMFVLGVAFCAFLEWGLLSYLKHQSFVRLNATAVQELDQDIRDHIARYGMDPLERLGWVKRRLNEFFAFIPVWFNIILLVGLVAYPLLRRSRWPILLLPLWVFIYQTWGTMRLTEYFPPSIKVRYYMPIIPFFAIIGAFVLVTLLRTLIEKTKPRALRRFLQAIAIALIIVLPLPGLRVADEKAGRLYRSAEIGGIVSAVRWTVNQGGQEPIVVSAYTSHRLFGMLFDRQPDRLRHARDLGQEQFFALLDTGGFYYLDIPKRYKRGMPNSDVDALLRFVISERIEPLPAEPVFADVAVYWSPETPGINRFKVGGYEGCAQKIGWFHHLTKRSAEAQVLFGNSMVRSRHVKSPGARAVQLCRISGRRTQSASETPAVIRLDNTPVSPLNGTTEAAEFQSETNLTRDSQQWRIMFPSKFSPTTAPAESPPFEKIDRDSSGPKLELNFDAGVYLWLVPAKGHEMSLDTCCRYDFLLDVTVQGSVKAELRFEMFKDPARKHRLMQKRIPLKNGMTQFGAWTDGNPVYIKPAFKVSGNGTFALNSFIVRGPNAPRTPVRPD